MKFNTLIWEQKEAGIAEIRINRPKSLNALSDEVFSEMDVFLSELEKDKSVRALIITGEGSAFASGADIGVMKDMSPFQIEDMVKTGFNVFKRIEHMDIISIAAVNSFAFGGGCELAMTCDMRIAAKTAQLGLPEVGLGIIPGSGGTQRLTRLVGIAKAKELILTGDIITADEALKIGLVNQVTEPEALMDTVYKIANRILKKGPIAVRYAKKAITTGADINLDAGLELEQGLFRLLFATSDQKEGMQAFFEKRKAQFKDA